MAKKIQIKISDRNNQKLLDVIASGEVESYEGNQGNNISSVGAYFLDLGIRIHEASKTKDGFDIDGFRKDLFDSVLNNVQLSKCIIMILNEQESFKGRDLIKEYYKDNDVLKKAIEDKKNKYFK